jgi:1-acyl-sn-glycerol-3-phosphate acyltransferase
MIHDLLAVWRSQASPLSRRALARLPATHVFAIRHNRFVTLLFQKIVYWVFKLRNRLEVIGFEHVQREIDAGGPFVVVANHSGTADVALQQSIQAHYDNIAFTFINGEGFIDKEFPPIAVALYFTEYIPRMGTGQQSIARTVRRLVAGDSVLFFPEGSFDYKETGRKLRLVPSCAIGMHEAYNPHNHPIRRFFHGHKHKHKHDRAAITAWQKQRLKWLPKIAHSRRPGQKVKVKFGPAFTVDVPVTHSAADIEAATDSTMLRVASLWGQKRLRPNMTHEWVKQSRPAVDGRRMWLG